MKINSCYSPNFSKKKRPFTSIKLIVIHYTGMQSERESIKRLCNPKTEVSSHFVITQYGKIYRLVRDNQIAWHAGKSCWERYKNLNKNSIGIELVNKGHQFGYTKFKKKQLSSLIKICRILTKKYKIKKKNIVGHSDISPLRKKDPGEKFPWKKLAKKQLGVWHDLKSETLQKMRKIKINKKDRKVFFSNLRKIGYFVKPSLKIKELNKITKAFQRHFRAELANGISDLECLKISINLSKKYQKKA